MGFTSSDLVFMHTLLTGRVRAREGRQRTTASSPLSPGSSASIKGEKHGRFLSLHCHNIDSRVSGNVAVSYAGEGRIEDLRNRTRDGIILMEAGPLLDCSVPVQGGWKY